MFLSFIADGRLTRFINKARWFFRAGPCQWKYDILIFVRLIFILALLWQNCCLAGLQTMGNTYSFSSDRHLSNHCFTFFWNLDPIKLLDDLWWFKWPFAFNDRLVYLFVLLLLFDLYRLVSGHPWLGLFCFRFCWLSAMQNGDDRFSDVIENALGLHGCNWRPITTDGLLLYRLTLADWKSRVK